MCYMLGRALHRMCRNLKIYFFIFVELVLGFAIIACQINVSKSVTERLREYERQFSKGGISINAYVKDSINAFESELPITYQDYVYIAEKYKEFVEVSYISYGSVWYNGINRIKVLGMSEKAMKNLLQTSEYKVYIGTDVKKILDNQSVKVENCEMEITEDRISVLGEDYPMQVLTEEQSKITLISHSAIVTFDEEISEAIIVPISMQQMFEESDILYNCALELIGRENVSMEKLNEISGEVVEYLSTMHEKYIYEGLNKIEEFEKSSRDFSETIELLAWIAKFTFILIIVGMIGVLLILLDKRQKDIMISFWVGAAKWKLGVELLLEILTLCLTGGAVALAISAMLAPILNNSRYLVSMTEEAVWVIMTMVVVISVVTSLTALLCIKRGKKG